MVYTVSQAIGDPIPNNTEHAVSVTLPTWEATVGYEEGQSWVVSKMTSGYPRFFIHSKIQNLAKLLEDAYGRGDEERVMIFPTYNVAKRCREFIKRRTTNPNCQVRILQLSTPGPKDDTEASFRVEANISAVFFPASEFPIAKQYWQHSGEGVSSRLGEYCLQELKGLEEAKKREEEANSRRNSRRSTSSAAEPTNEYSTFIEERFGRNLDLRFSKEAKTLLRRRIAGKIDDETTSRGAVSEDDVYLYPSGMASIFNAHQILLNTSELKDKKSVCFGFPYVDTLNILRKWGAGVHFLGFGDDASLDELEARLESGERILSLFAECPSNPLLKTPNLPRIKQLSDKYGFAVVVDETVGNFLNIHVLPYVDIVVSSLTKVFSGDSNVMAGSLVLNPESKYYSTFKQYMNSNFEDLFWDQDAIYLERNSRDFESRAYKINDNAVEVLKLLQQSPLIDQIYYPTLLPSKKYYDAIKTQRGGYGGLVSFVFKDQRDAVCFFNQVALSKGPSLGTNFTLACPYAILAHYNELDEVEKWGVDRNLVRMSIGLEPTQDLLDILQKALDSAQEQH